MKKSHRFKKYCEVLVFIGLSYFIMMTSSWAVTQVRPEALILLPENEHAILVEKKTQTLFLYSASDQDIVMELKMACSTGEASGVKQKSGDKKTPEGIYFLIDEYEDRYLTPVYGKKAFPTDYPNLMDKRAGKNGSAIWIHGTNKTLKPMDSNGCVALENENILELSKYITLDSTPVIMVEEIKSGDDKLHQKDHDIRQLLDGWVTALKNGTYHDYLSFYSSTYLPDIQWWQEWTNIRKQAIDLGSNYNLTVSKTGIYQHENLVVVLFDSFFIFGNEKIYLGKRKLFLESNDHGSEKDVGYKIVGDRLQRTPKRFEKIKNPLIAAARLHVMPERKNQAVLKTVHQWIAAWTAKNMDKYASFYAKNFYSDNLTKTQWVKRKRALAKKYNYINVSGTDFKVKTMDKKAEIVFFQEYESSKFSTQGTKTLKLVDEGGLWKIYQESWKEK